jgi:hypothetical protein
MSSWGNNDNAANTPLWSVARVNKFVNTANQTLLYANTTANAFASTLADGSIRNNNLTIGVFGVDVQEAVSYQGTTNPHAPHAGWVLRTVGSGGRAGRVTNETLVAFSRIKGDGDAQVFPNVSITLVTTGNKSVLANATYFANTTSFTVTPTLAGNTAATLTYQWQYNNASGTYNWASIPANTADIHFAGSTTATLYAMPGTTANTTNVYRAVVTAANQGVVATSGNNTITIT